jgi:hypothetical protein
MKEYSIEKVEAKRMTSVTCDVCKKNYKFEGCEYLEAQEFHSIEFEGGYSSVFGDGNLVQADICQHCLEDLLGDYLRITE